MKNLFSSARAASGKPVGRVRKVNSHPVQWRQSLAKLMEQPITGRRMRSVPGWMLAGACSLLLGAEAAVGVDLDLTSFSSNRQALVTLNGGTGQWHRIEASTNLLDWRALTNLCLTNPASAWLDTGATNFPQRFYRSQQLTPLDRLCGHARYQLQLRPVEYDSGRRADDVTCWRCGRRSG